MNNAALKIDTQNDQPHLSLVDNIANKSTNNVISYYSLVKILSLTLICIQILDGIFTNLGIAQYGVGIEGNPLLQSLMLKYDYTLVLASTKIIAILIILGITYSAKYIDWIHYAMFTIIGVYLSAAIVPWTYILFF
jgi:hypothetical protein